MFEWLEARGGRWSQPSWPLARGRKPPDTDHDCLPHAASDIWDDWIRAVAITLPMILNWPSSKEASLLRLKNTSCRVLFFFFLTYLMFLSRSKWWKHWKCFLVIVSAQSSLLFDRLISFTSGFLTINDIICVDLHRGNKTKISSLFHQIVQRTAEGVLIKMVI